MKPTGPTNNEISSLINELRRTKDPFSLRISKELSKSGRAKKGVNVYKLEKVCKDNDVVVVPSKVLGFGNISKSLKVYAASFSKGAEEKIRKSGGAALPLSEFLQSKGKNTKLVV